jgi:hypothetical protein
MKAKTWRTEASITPGRSSKEAQAEGGHHGLHEVIEAPRPQGPDGRGGMASVGESRTSRVAKNRAIRRAMFCRRPRARSASATT